MPIPFSSSPKAGPSTAVLKSSGSSHQGKDGGREKIPKACIITTCTAIMVEGRPFASESPQPSGITVQTELYRESESECDMSSSIELNQGEDPINWRSCRKIVAFSLVCWLCILSGFAMGFAKVQVKAQREEWALDTSDVDLVCIFSITALMQGFGGIVLGVFIKRFGSVPVIFWASCVLSCTTMVCSLLETWTQYLTARAFEGFFGSVGIVLGPQVIYDLYRPEQYVGQIGIWATLVMFGPACGSLVSSTLVINWRAGSIGLWAAHGLTLVLIAVFAEETSYNKVSPGNGPLPQGSWLAERMRLLLGHTGYNAQGRDSLRNGLRTMYMVMWRPQFVVPALPHMIAWSVAIALDNIAVFTLLRVEGFGYNPTRNFIGFVYMTPLIGLGFAQAWGSAFNEWRQSLAIRRHGTIIPETVLTGCYIPMVVTIIGFFVFAVWTQELYHWLGLLFAWAFAIIAAFNIFVPVTTYVLYCFPTHAIASAATLGLLRAIVVFIGQLYIPNWIDKLGLYICLAIQGCLMAVSASTITAVQFWGPGWRNSFHIPGEIKITEIPIKTKHREKRDESTGWGRRDGHARSRSEVWDGVEL